MNGKEIVLDPLLGHQISEMEERSEVDETEEGGAGFLVVYNGGDDGFVAGGGVF